MADRAPRSRTTSRTAKATTESLTVRPGVKALASTGDAALLVRERHADGTPFWTLPGGGVHRAESPQRALVRELDEELCCRCVPGDRVTSFCYAHASLPATVSAYTVYECSLLTRPIPVADEGVTECRWIEADSLPARTLPQVRLVLEEFLDN